MTNFWCDSQLIAEQADRGGDGGLARRAARSSAAPAAPRARACRRACRARGSASSWSGPSSFATSLIGAKRVGGVIVAERRRSPRCDRDPARAARATPAPPAPAARRRRRPAPASARDGRTRRPPCRASPAGAPTSRVLAVVLEIGVGDGAQAIVGIVERRGHHLARARVVESRQQHERAEPDVAVGVPAGGARSAPAPPGRPARGARRARPRSGPAPSNLPEIVDRGLELRRRRRLRGARETPAAAQRRRRDQREDERGALITRPP